MGLLDRWIKRKTEEQLHKEVAPKDSEKKTKTLESSVTPKKEESPVAPKVEEKKTSTKLKTSAKIKKENKKEEKTKLAEVSNTKSLGNSYHVILKPLVSEKSTVLESAHKYVFLISRSATKDQVKKAIKELYGINALQVNIAHIQGKNTRFGRTLGKRSDYKKAIITLPKDSAIKIHEAV